MGNSGTHRLTNVGHPSKIGIVLPPVAERVAIIRELMARLEWDGEAERRLRAEWHCSTVRVRLAAAEASRQIAAAGDAVEARRRVEYNLAGMETACRQLESARRYFEAGKLRAELAKIAARVGGLDRQRIVLEGAGGTDAVLAGIGGEEP